MFAGDRLYLLSLEGLETAFSQVIISIFIVCGGVSMFASRFSYLLSVGVRGDKCIVLPAGPG